MICRIDDRATFAMFGRGTRAAYGPVRVRYVRAEPSSTSESPARVAYAINRKVGTAVVRNRVRRRLRAALDELDRAPSGALPGGAYLFSADARVVELPYPELKRVVGCVLERACGRG